MFELSHANAAAWAKAFFIVLLVFLLGISIDYSWRIALGGDTAVYHHYSQVIWAGAVPYRDILIEYPPGALPFILLAAPLGYTVHNYTTGFAILGVVALVIIVRHLMSRYRLKGLILCCLAIIPIAMFFFFLLDVFAAVALYWAVILHMQKKYRWSAVLLAASVLIKGYPIVCLPVILLAIPKTALKKYLKVFGLTVTGGILPFLLLSPSGIWASVTYQLGRPLQMESAAATIGYIFRVFGEPLKIFESHKSFAISFPGSGLISLLATALLIGGLAWFMFWLYKLKTRPDPALSCAAGILIFVIFFKVGSPQYLVPVWLLLAIALNKFKDPDRIRIALRLMAVGVVIYLTFVNYRQLIRLESFALALVVIRYVLLAELLVWVIKKLKQQSQPVLAN